MLKKLTSAARLIVVACIAVLLVGCVSTPPVSGLKPAQKRTVPTAIIARTLDPYQLQIGDVIEIKLMYNKELNDTVTVQPDGMISTSVVQNVKAYGRTTANIRSELIKLYSKQLRDPHITVVVRSFAPNRVYVLGEVNSPGEFVTIGPNLTLLQAIARAGGVKNSAHPNKIIIVRRGAGEEPFAAIANYKSAVSGADPTDDVRLASYDVVYVPRSPIGDTYLNYQQYIQQFMPASMGFSSPVP